MLAFILIICAQIITKTITKSKINQDEASVLPYFKIGFREEGVVRGGVDGGWWC